MTRPAIMLCRAVANMAGAALQLAALGVALSLSAYIQPVAWPAVALIMAAMLASSIALATYGLRDAAAVYQGRGRP